MYKYEVIICWSNDDDTFVAEAPELPRCMAHGDTQEVALQNINEAMALWIDTAREFGDPLPETPDAGMSRCYRSFPCAWPSVCCK